MYRKSQNQNRGLLISALPLALMILFVLFSQFNTPATLAQQDTTATASQPAPTLTESDLVPVLPTDTELPPAPNLLDPQQQLNEYASAAHALQAQALVADQPFLAYRLAVEAGSISNPPAEAYSALLSMVYDNSALNSYDTLSSSALAISMSADGQMVEIFTNDGELKLFDTATHELLNTYRAPRGYFTGADFTPDGSRLYLTQPDNQLMLEWNITTGHTSRIAVDQPMGFLKIAPDGQRALTTGYYEGDIFIWDLVAHKILNTFTGYAGSTPFSVAFSPDGNLALVGYYDSTVKLFDLTTGLEVRSFYGQGYPISGLAFSFAGGIAYMADTNGGMYSISITDGSIYSFVNSAIPAGIYSLALSPYDGYVVLGGADGTIRLWNTESEEFVFETHIHQTRIDHIIFSPDGTGFITSDSTGKAYLWLLYGGGYLNRHGFYRQSGGVTSVAFSPDGQFVASGGGQNDILLWNIDTISVANTLLGHTGYINDLAFSPDGRYLLSASADSTARLWDVTTGETVTTYTVTNNQIYKVRFSPDGHTAFMGTDTGAVLIDTDPDSATFGDTLHTFEVPDTALVSVDYSPDGSTLAGGSGMGDIFIWDFATYAELQHVVVSDGSHISNVRYSPDGTIVAASLWNSGYIELWDIGSGQLLRTLEGHFGGTYAIDFNPDGRTLISGGNDNAVILWDVATGQQIRTYNGHSNIITDVAFSPDGRTALSSSWDSSVQIWTIPTIPELMNMLLTERYVPELTCDQRTAYRVEPYCDSAGSAPTAMPFPTLTPTVQMTSLIISSTSSEPTNTPSATAVAAANIAHLGTQHGETAVGGGEIWTYNGSFGEVLNILVEADQPANDNQDQTGLFDTYISIVSPTGVVLYVADDIESGIITDSQIRDFTLPTTGTFFIEVRSWNDQSGGGYTLTLDSTPYLTPTPFMG